MATINEGILTPALVEIGVLSEGETPTSGQSTIALNYLNRLYDQWAAEGLQLFSITRTTFALTANDGEYTVGSGGNFNIAPRPVDLEDVRYIDTSTTPDTEYPLTRLTEQAYQGISQKAATATFPRSWYYNPTFASSLGNLMFFPIPTSTTLTGVIYHRAPITYPVAISDTLTLPPGYEELLVTTLACRLAVPFGRPVDPELKARASEAKRIVERNNLRMSDLSFDGGALIGSPSHFNVWTGQ